MHNDNKGKGYKSENPNALKLPQKPCGAPVSGEKMAKPKPNEQGQ